MIAEPVHVQRLQGATRGFLTIRSESGNVLGYAELFSLTRGDRVNSRLSYHFRDGSIDEETVVYTQRTEFHLVSDHHIQRGPFFSKPIDILTEANGQITVRSKDKDGKEQVEVNHIDLPPDVCNGFMSTILTNTRPDAAPFKVALLAATGKGRLIHVSIAPESEGTFTAVAGIRRKATIFRLHPELGGVAGVVAPVIGKQPDDALVWVLEGEVPVVVREVSQLAQGGPTISLELGGTSFTHSTIRTRHR